MPLVSESKLKLKVESFSKVLKDTSRLLSSTSLGWDKAELETSSDGECPVMFWDNVIELCSSIFDSSFVCTESDVNVGLGEIFELDPVRGVRPLLVSCVLSDATSALSFSISFAISSGDRITFAAALFLIRLARSAN